MIRNSLNRSFLILLLVLMAVFIHSTAFAVTNITSATLNGAVSVTVVPGATISAQVNVTVDPGDSWKSTRWLIASADGAGSTCVDSGDFNQGNHSAVFDIMAPAGEAIYNVYFEAFSDDSCTVSVSSVYLLTDAVTVTKATTTTFSVIPSPSTYGAELDITVTVSGGSPTPTGTVELKIGGADCTDATTLSIILTLDGNGQILEKASPLIPIGTYTGTLRACYSGDAAHDPSEGAIADHTVIKADQQMTVDGPASVTYGSTGTISYSCPGLGCPGTGAISYSHGGSTGCTVDTTSGVITVTNASGTCSVTVTKAEDVNYNSATSDEFPVTLNKANQTPLTVTGPASVTYGTPGQITTSGGSGTGAFSYSDGGSTGCTVDPTTGVITVTNADASGTCSVTATKGADNNYNSVTSSIANITLNANQTTLIVTGPASVTYGETGTITHSGGSGSGAESYSHGGSTGCTVDTISGVITVTNASGTCIVTMTKDADGTYLAATSDPLQVTLNKATPTAVLSVTNSPVTFDNSGHAATVDIVSSSVPGSLSNILTGGEATKTFIGTYAVTADFTPTDTDNYTGLNSVPAGDFVIVGPSHLVIPAATGNGNITLDANCNFTTWGVKTEAQVGDDGSYAYPYGLVEFTLDCADAIVVITYPGDISRAEYRKYGPTTPGDDNTIAWYTMSAKITGNQVILHLKDNERGDDSGLDGRIVDQGGPGLLPAALPTMTEWGMFIFMVFAGLLSVYYLKRQRNSER